jgi:hypothetical protein
VRAQIAAVEAAIASRIVKTYTLQTGETEIRGRQRQAAIASSVTSGGLQIFCTGDFISGLSPNIELIEAITNHCQIEKAAHLLLLTLTLGGASLEQIRSGFTQQGLHVRIPKNEGMLNVL